MKDLVSRDQLSLNWDSSATIYPNVNSRGSIAGGHEYKQIYRSTNRHTGILPDRNENTQTGILTGIQEYIHTDRPNGIFFEISSTEGAPACAAPSGKFLKNSGV